jgi:hypothetical protein
MSEIQTQSEEKPHDSIFDRQNEPWALGLLAAQKWSYSRAKTWAALALGIAGLGAGVPPMFVKYCAYCLPDHFPYYSIGVIILLVSFCRTVAFFLRKKAAGIQEQFDVQLFEKVGLSPKRTRQPSSKLIQRALLWGKNGNLMDWYGMPSPPLIDVVHTVFFCQKQNLGWNQTLNQRFSRGLSKILLFYLLVLLGLSILYFCGWDSKLWWEHFMIFQIPLLFLLIWVHRHHRRSTEENQQTLANIQPLLEKYQNNPNQAPDVQTIQDAIYNIRVNNEPIPDWFYNWHRPVLNQITYYKTQKGGTVAVESIKPQGIWARLGFFSDSPITAAKGLEEALAPIKQVADTVIEHLESTQAEEINIELGLRLEAGVEAAIAKATGEGQIKVSVKWTNKS